MAAVYSTRFLSLPAFSGGPSAVFTVPSGYRAVVRTLGIVWGDVTLSDLDAWFQTSDLTKLCRITINGGSSVPEVIGGCLISDGRWVLEQGDTLAGQTADGTVDMHAAGYLLTLP